MTRFIHDQFAKDYLEELLKPYGEVKASSRVAGEVREIDVLFSPAQEANNLEMLGLLGIFAATPAIFEPLRVRQSLMGETPKTALAHHFAILPLKKKSVIVC
jgi:hypothetical protein